MYIGQLDVAIRAGAVSTVLLLALLLFGQRRQIGLPAALFAPLALCLAGFVIGNTPITSLAPAGFVGAIVHIVSGFTVVFLWWFCLSCFDSQFQLKDLVLEVGLLWTVIAALDRGLLGQAFCGRRAIASRRMALSRRHAVIARDRLFELIDPFQDNGAVVLQGNVPILDAGQSSRYRDK